MKAVCAKACILRERMRAIEKAMVVEEVEWQNTEEIQCLVVNFLGGTDAGISVIEKQFLTFSYL